MSQVSMTTHLVRPYGGRLIDLQAPSEERVEPTRRTGELVSVQLSARAMGDLELFGAGAFSPLDRFMGKADYVRVLEEMRLADGTLFPIPITLRVSDTKIRVGQEIALRSPKNNLLAWMRVDEIYEADPAAEALAVLGTDDEKHPLVSEMRFWGRFCISGELRVIELPRHPDFPEFRRCPVPVRTLLDAI